jgi:hypothetical protein
MLVAMFLTQLWFWYSIYTWYKTKAIYFLKPYPSNNFYIMTTCFISFPFDTLISSLINVASVVFSPISGLGTPDVLGTKLRPFIFLNHILAPTFIL